MKVSALQLHNYIGNKESSFSASETLIQKAASEGSKLVALPELSTCGYIPNEGIWKYGEKSDGVTAQWACRMAKKYSLHIGAGYLETDEREFYNTYLIASPEGKIKGQVRKTRAESYCFKSSNIGNVIKTEIGKIAIGICADNHELWFYDKLSSLDFDLLLMPHAWATPYTSGKYVQPDDITDSKHNVDTLGSIYASGFGVPVIFINSVGEVPPMRGILGKFMSPDYFRLQGGSAVFQPDGTAMRIEGSNEQVITSEIELGHKKMMSDKPAIYQGWLHPGSWLSRKVIIPLDRAFGSYYYRKHH